MSDDNPSGKLTKTSIVPNLGCPFHAILESLGLFEYGQPAPYLFPVTDADGKQLGWYHLIEGLGVEGLADDSPQIYDRLELIVPKYHLLISAWSELYDRTDEPA